MDLFRPSLSSVKLQTSRYPANGGVDTVVHTVGRFLTHTALRRRAFICTTHRPHARRPQLGVRPSNPVRISRAKLPVGNLLIHFFARRVDGSRAKSATAIRSRSGPLGGWRCSRNGANARWRNGHRRLLRPGSWRSAQRLGEVERRGQCGSQLESDHRWTQLSPNAINLSRLLVRHGVAS